MLSVVVWEADVWKQAQPNMVILRGAACAQAGLPGVLFVPFWKAGRTTTATRGGKQRGSGLLCMTPGGGTEK